MFSSLRGFLGACRSPHLRSIPFALIAILAAPPFLAPPASAAYWQEEERDERLDAIQRQLETLTQQVEELRAALAEQEAEGAEEPESADEPPALAVDPSWIEALDWRSIGPAAMGGRIVALAVYEADPSIYWVATASGGLLKTSNNGVTFEHQFDHENTVSIGDVAVAPSDPEIVWVGTGENNPRNSVSYGDGVYKSTDGGKTWEHMGLKESFQIGRIAIHPEDPEVVYVGALGRLYGPNEQRGLFKTTDGGESWEKILYVDENTGVIDVQMHPEDPETLIVATYERRRDEFDVGDPAVKYGEGSAIYKTTDGGESFEKLTEGLPTGKLGRVGIDYYRANPDVVFAIVEAEDIGKGPKPDEDEKQPALMGIQGENGDPGAKLNTVTDGGPSDEAGLEAGDIVIEMEGNEIETYQDLIDIIRDHYAGDTVPLKVKRGEETLEFELTFGARPTGGRDPERPFGARLGGQQANKQDEQGDEGFEYGGVYKSTDGGDSWTRVNSLNPRPMYFSQIRVDPSDENYVYVLGIALHVSKDGGKEFSADGGRGVHADHHAMWIDPNDGRHILLGCDGGVYQSYDRCGNWDHLNQTALGQFYHVAVGPRRMYYAYGGLQDNGTWGGPAATRNGQGPVNEDWLRIGGGDGFKVRVDPENPNLIYYTSQYGNLQRRDLETGQGASIRPPRERGRDDRYNWNTPFLLSHHNPKIYYAAGNYVFKSLDRGEDMKIISPEITRTDRGSALALNESPIDPDVLYVGTDDGKLWVTTDGGQEWKDVTEALDLPGPRGINTIEPSKFEAGRCYVAVDGHRNDDDTPYLFVTEDYGESWTNISANLPWGTTRCLREDIENPDLLFCGTEFATWFSIDRGNSWQKLNGDDLPTVAIHEIAIHPTAGEIVVGTHGRSLWALDVTPLRELTEEVLEAEAHLYETLPAVRWKNEPSRGGTNRKFYGENPDRGAVIHYSLTEEAEEVDLSIVDATGETVRNLRAPETEGLHRVVWDLAANPPEGQRGRRRRGRPVPPGTYGILLNVDGETFRQTLRVERDPILPSDGVIAADEDEAFEETEDDADEPLTEEELEALELID